MTNSGKAPQRDFRERMSDLGGWLMLAFVMMTLPVSFPLIVLYKRVRGEKLHGKGLGILFAFWVISTGVLGLLLAAYAHKGSDGLRTLFYILVFGIIWAIVVFLAMRLMIELVVAVWRFWGWLQNRLKK